MSKRRKTSRHRSGHGMQRAPLIPETKLLQALGRPTIDDLRRERLAQDAAERNAEYEAFREARRQEALAAELRAKWDDAPRATDAPAPPAEEARP